MCVYPYQKSSKVTLETQSLIARCGHDGAVQLSLLTASAQESGEVSAAPLLSEEGRSLERPATFEIAVLVLEGAEVVLAATRHAHCAYWKTRLMINDRTQHTPFGTYQLERRFDLGGRSSLSETSKPRRSSGCGRWARCWRSRRG